MGKHLMIIIFICMHMAWCVDGQSKDMQTPAVRALNDPRNDVDKQTYKSHIGGSDRFKFYYMGLGKRSGKDLAFPGDNPHDVTIDKFVSHSQSPASHLDVLKISKQKSPGLTNARLKNTVFYRRMKSNTYDKRDPELFTEDLYPIQSGKQQLEAYMDSALDQMNTWVEEKSQNEKSVDEISAVEMAKQLHNDNVDDEPPTSEIKTQSFDLSFSSPDSDLSSYPLEHNGDSIDKADANGDTTEKRGWAAGRLYKLIVPKSTKWSPRVGEPKTR